jgi:hypothetical protein
MIKLLIFSLLLSNLCIADTFSPTNTPLPDAVPISKGEESPMDGIVISQTKAQQIKNVTDQRDTLQLQNDSLTKSLNIQSNIIQLDQNKVTILLNQDDTLAKRLNESQQLNNWEKAGYFFLGLAVPCIAGYAYKSFAK